MYRFKRVESIRNVVLLAALRSSSFFNLQLYSLSMHDNPNEANYCITRSLCHDIGSEAPRRVALGCRHSTARPGLLAASHIVRL
jgi:hypothetical protein